LFVLQLAGLALNVKKKMPREQSVADQHAERNNNTSQPGKGTHRAEDITVEGSRGGSFKEIELSRLVKPAKV
jgi:hypothetical protein